MSVSYKTAEILTTKRPCLGCKKPFKSEGSHNRLCINCNRHINRGVPVARQREGWVAR